MRTKTLLFAAAALAAGLVTSQAQVYSGIVGYVNASITNSYVLLANPLDAGTNDLNTLLGILPNKATVQVWNGSSFTPSTKGGSPSVWTPDLTVAPGAGFFVKLNSGGTNVTFVGQVDTAVGGSITNSLPTTYVLLGSPLPFSTDLNDTNLGLNVLPNKSTIQVWNGSAYTPSTKGGSPSVWSPDQTIPVGTGIFIQAKSATNWIQTLPSN
jgi:hypothetical protein